MQPRLARVLAILTTAAFISLPFVAFAQTADVSSQVQSLMSQIQSLQQQLQTLLASVHASSTWMMESSTTPSGNPTSGQSGMMPCATFSRDLSEGQSGDDVTQLQQTLTEDGFLNASSTGFFGPMTAHALAQFQTHFGIASSTGFFGPLTRKFLRQHCGGESGQATSTPFVWGGSGTTSMPMMPWHPGDNGASTSPAHPMSPCSGEEHPMLLMLHAFVPGMQGPCETNSGGNVGSSTAPSAPSDN